MTPRRPKSRPVGAASRAARRACALAALLAAVLLAGCGAPDATHPGADPAASDPGRGASDIGFFAAASLTDVAPLLTAAYARETGDTRGIPINLASSARLVQQANSGEVPDVMVTADAASLDALARPGEFRRLGDVALNRLVIAVRPGSGIADAGGLATAGAVALCAPSVPCGRAAGDYLERKGLRLATVTEEDSVRAVLSKVASGQVDAGFVYATDAAAAGDAVETVPLDVEIAPNAYPLLLAADAPAAAESFAAWLLGDTAAGILAEAGFERP